MSPTLSIIVASHNARASIEACLDSLVRQMDQSVELIVVDNSVDGSADLVRARYTRVHLLALAPTALVNELWSAGIQESHGAIVALTTAHCIPADDWVAQVFEAHESPTAGVGGAIDGESGSGLTDWAVFFCRYSRFMPPLAEGKGIDIAADNAAYKREPLFRHEDQWRSGFWEPQLHEALLKEGQELKLCPGMLVRHRHSFGFASFMRQRFRHGRQFGGWRASNLTPTKRLIYLAAAPLIPLVLLQRTVRVVLGKGRHVSKLIAALPMLAAFFGAWVCGEALGYARGSSR